RRHDHEQFQIVHSEPAAPTGNGESIRSNSSAPPPSSRRRSHSGGERPPSTNVTGRRTLAIVWQRGISHELSATCPDDRPQFLLPGAGLSSARAVLPGEARTEFLSAFVVDRRVLLRRAISAVGRRCPRGTVILPVGTRWHRSAGVSFGHRRAALV